MTAVPTPIPSRTQFVLEGIKHRILTGQLTPGQALVETELAAQFGVSKTPVREALKTLAGTGLVVMSQYKGVTVRMVDADMAREVYDVRLLLEPEALRRSVRRGAPWDAASDALTRADEATDTAERSLANREFHRAIYRASGNRTLADLLDRLWDQTDRYRLIALQDEQHERSAEQEHRRIAAAVRARDRDLVERLMASHVEATLRLIERHADVR